MVGPLLKSYYCVADWWMDSLAPLVLHRQVYVNMPTWPHGSCVKLRLDESTKDGTHEVVQPLLYVPVLDQLKVKASLLLSTILLPRPVST